MASLGTFAAAAREYDPDRADVDTFEFYGETFTVVGEIPAMVELTLSAGMAGRANAVETDAAQWDVLRFALTVPEHTRDGETVAADGSQWETFQRLATDRGADDETLAAVALTILGAKVGRPTGRRSTSSDGSLPTSTNSNSSASDSPDSPDSSPAGAG